MQFDDETIRNLFGTDTAEDDDPQRLRAYFLKNKSYESIRSSLPLRILVGHKGIGKTALLRMSFLEDTDQNILSLWLKPDDFIGIDLKDKSFVEKIGEYKRVIGQLIYHQSLEKLGVEADSTAVKFTLANIGKQVLTGVVRKIAESSGVDTGRITTSVRQAFNRDKSITIYIDDVDRGWTASTDDINAISALVNACRDMSNDEPNIRIRIGLRSDAYFLYRTSDESTDKVEGNVIHLKWNRHDILTVMALRVANYLKSNIDPRSLENLPQSEVAKELHPVVEDRYRVGKGAWLDKPIHIILLSLNRNRPRDLVKLLTLAAQNAFQNSRSLISSTDVAAVFENYSAGRIRDLVLEFRSELPEIEKLLLNMGPTTKEMKTADDTYHSAKREGLSERELESIKAKSSVWIFSNDQLINKIRNIRQSHNFSFKNGQNVNERTIAEFLYKIDFIIARDEHPDGRPRWTSFDQNQMLKSQFRDFGYKWEVHPAYRWALQPKSANQIIDTIYSSEQD